MDYLVKEGITRPSIQTLSPDLFPDFDSRGEVTRRLLDDLLYGSVLLTAPEEGMEAVVATPSGLYSFGIVTWYEDGPPSDSTGKVFRIETELIAKVLRLFTCHDFLDVPLAIRVS